MNDLAIFVGGAPNAPIKWNGSGDGAVLGGSPPSGNFGIAQNQYFFIGNTAANPSRIQWSIFGNPEDWSGTGSGTQDIAPNDGDTLVGASPLGNDRLILFKQNSIHEMITRNPPFPVYPKFSGYGAVSKRGIINIGDIIYFVTPEPRLKATDGFRIYDFSSDIDNIWDGLNKSRLKYLKLFHNKRLNQLWCICSYGTATTNNYNIVLDLDKKVWLRHTSGFGMNDIITAQDRTIYGGAYNGVIYQLDKESTYADASESGAAIDAYWRSGWIDFNEMIEGKTIRYVDVNYKAQASGTFTFSYGFDFSSDRKTETIAMYGLGGKYGSAVYGSSVYGGTLDGTKLVFMKGQGKFIQFRIRNNNLNESLLFNGFSIPVKKLLAKFG
jgi:hypothetical protein